MRRANRAKSNLGALIVWALSIVVVCLAAFNFYLFSWLWSSLSGVAGRRTSLNLVASWNSIALEGRLAALGRFQTAQVRVHKDQQELQIRSKSSIQVGAGNSSAALLELTANESKIYLPRGLQLKSPARNSSIALDCRPADSSCLVRTANVRLANLGGLDFGRKSAQSSQVCTRRLHSATRALSLLAPNANSSLESRDGSVELIALDQVALFARNSHVILNSKTIDISGVGGLDKVRAARTKARAYRLCVCFQSKSNAKGRTQRPQGDLWVEPPHSSAGLVFGIRAELSCSQFTSFCQRRTAES